LPIHHQRPQLPPLPLSADAPDGGNAARCRLARFRVCVLQ
jgi:hypothetical protein